jgi:hypothetical protein
VPDLYSQLRTWYELLVLGKDPTTDIRPFQLIRNWRATLRAVLEKTVSKRTLTPTTPLR